MTGANNNEEHQEDVVEEDWSNLNHGDFEYYGTNIFLLSALEEETTSMTSTAVKQNRPLQMKLQCVESLTPLDMLDLSNGIGDATGNRIWMGALFFIECFVRPLPRLSTNNETFYSKIRAMSELRSALFFNKRILELGAGTGASLIAIGLAGTVCEHVKPKSLTLTDNDPVVLALCEKNCITNFNDDVDVSFQVCALDWGKDNVEKIMHASDHDDDDTDNRRGRKHIYVSSQDTVVATDVIYDLSALQPLFETASILVKTAGFFVLSHVPRACIDCDWKDIRDALEHEIINEAAKHNFALITSSSMACGNDENLYSSISEVVGKDDHAIRPIAFMDLWGDAKMLSSSDDCDFLELDSVGASIIIFRRE
jgi:hypothetical protein